MKKFEIGKKYFMFSICDHNAIWRYEVIKKTAKMITLKDLSDGEIIRKKINVLEDEFCYPIGHYSMAPLLRSTREVQNEK